MIGGYIPFGKDNSKYFLPGISLLLVFITSLILLGGVATFNLLNSWNKSVSGVITVQIPTFDEQGEPREEAVGVDIENALIILRSAVGIKGAEVLSETQMRALMSPWLGDLDTNNLPVPKLIDVRLEENVRVDFAKLQEELKAQVPSATIDTHRAWLKDLVDLSHSLLTVVFVVLFIVILSVSVTITYTTNASLSVHHPIISLMHMMGATDGSIIMQYAFRSFKLVFVGGFLACVLSVPLAISVSMFIQKMFNMGDWFFSGQDLIILCAVPVFVSLLAYVTTAVTVRAYLRKFL